MRFKKSIEMTISVITPTGGFRLEGLIYGQAISFLIDSRAAVTLIGKDTLDQVMQGLIVVLEPYGDQQLVTVDSMLLHIQV